MKTIALHKTIGQYDVTVQQRSNGKFRVTYGSEVKDNLDYLRAAEEMGYCIMHAAQCAGLIEEND